MCIMQQKKPIKAYSGSRMPVPRGPSISNCNLLRITKAADGKVSVQSVCSDRQAPGKSEEVFRLSRSPGGKVYRFLKLISPVHDQSEEIQQLAKKYICLPFVKDSQWKETVEYLMLFKRAVSGDKMWDKYRPSTISFSLFPTV